MFDIEAKDYDVTIHNFRIPFLRAAESVKISIWVHDGPFWYEKNNVDAWTWVGSPDAYSPGETNFLLLLMQSESASMTHIWCYLFVKRCYFGRSRASPVTWWN